MALNNGGFTLLWNKILVSSIWVEDHATRIVWISLLALRDKNGHVIASVPGLASLARVTVQECRTALEKFMAPDPDSSSKVEEGRRIRPIEGGWALINFEAYRHAAGTQEYWRMQKQAERERRKEAKEKPAAPIIKLNKDGVPY